MGYIREYVLQEGEMGRIVERNTEKQCQSIMFSDIVCLQNWRLCWFTQVSFLNAFLAGGSDDAWADAEDISEEDSALRFVCITDMSSFLAFEKTLNASGWLNPYNWCLLIYCQRKSQRQKDIGPFKRSLNYTEIFYFTIKIRSPRWRKYSASYLLVAEQSKIRGRRP